MWTDNNVTRPFRVATAAALEPVIDRGLRRIQKYVNFPSLVYAFALVVGIMATSCSMVVGLLIGESEMEISPADCVELCSPPKS